MEQAKNEYKKFLELDESASPASSRSANSFIKDNQAQSNSDSPAHSPKKSSSPKRNANSNINVELLSPVTRAN